MSKKDNNTSEIILGIILIIILILGVCFMFRWGFIVKDDDGWSLNCPMNDNDTLSNDSDSNGGSNNDYTDYEDDEPTCYDTDGGNYIMIYGECTDGDGTTVDVCPTGDGTEYVSEAYCQDGVCSGLSQPCPIGTWCWDGECKSYYQTPRVCTSIWNPSKTECSIYGICPDGYECLYDFGDIAHPDSCYCEEIVF